jgi:xylulokinase
LGETLHAPSSVQFLPYLSGERTPHNDVKIRGNIYGIDHGTGRADLTRSVLQGVAFAFRDGLEALQSAGTVIDQLFAVGGGSQSKIWLKTIATTLDLPIHIPVAGDQGAAFGAARLGMAAATGADPIDLCTPPRIVETIEPDATLVPDYRRAWGQYSAFYPALREALAS